MTFKIYMSDPGLLCAKQDVVPGDILYLTGEMNDFKGGLTENYVDCQLVSNGDQPYYWTRDNGVEVDFLIQKEGKIIPVEVKSADHVRARGLKLCMEQYHPDYAIRISGENFGFEGGIKAVPLYAVWCIW